ncbi:hypothetical protein Tco_0861370 [Tanacetum coccineum]|uniref:Uncharacterized protein n=1 Tax=Tanacetum coccineum TaxID=301880 RepID=A0ABQ5BL95_9ASTR
MKEKVRLGFTSYLWHCCIALIGLTRMQKLHREGLLENIDEESFDNANLCLKGTKRAPNKSVSNHGGARDEEMNSIKVNEVWTEVDLIIMQISKECNKGHDVALLKTWAVVSVMRPGSCDKIYEVSEGYVFIVNGRSSRLEEQS